MTASEAAVKRYTDAYRGPAALERTGEFFKWAGAIIGALIFLAGLDADRAMEIFVAWMLGSIAGLIIYGLGALICAHAHLLRAALDNAVNSSAFLSAQERAAVLTLAPQQPWSPLGLDSLAGVEVEPESKGYDWERRHSLESPVAALIYGAPPLPLRSQRRPLRQTRRRLF